jgi:hypothetical protein
LGKPPGAAATKAGGSISPARAGGSAAGDGLKRTGVGGGVKKETPSMEPISDAGGGREVEALASHAAAVPPVASGSNVPASYVVSSSGDVKTGHATAPLAATNGRSGSIASAFGGVPVAGAVPTGPHSAGKEKGTAALLLVPGPAPIGTQASKEAVLSSVVAACVC